MAATSQVVKAQQLVTIAREVAALPDREGDAAAVAELVRRARALAAKPPPID